MLLSGTTIAERLLGKGPKNERIEIAPRPDLTQLREKATASVDLRLGCWFLAPRTSRATHFDAYKEDAEHRFVRRLFVPLGKPFILHPHEFVLAATMEWICMPENLAGYVTGKSSWGRRGLVIETAPGVHPLYTGCITLEVANVGQIPIEILPGTEICQLFLHRAQGEQPTTSSSHFACRRQPTLGVVKKTPLIEKLLEARTVRETTQRQREESREQARVKRLEKKEAEARAEEARMQATARPKRKRRVSKKK